MCLCEILDFYNVKVFVYLFLIMVLDLFFKYFVKLLCDFKRLLIIFVWKVKIVFFIECISVLIFERYWIVLLVDDMMVYVLWLGFIFVRDCIGLWWVNSWCFYSK